MLRTPLILLLLTGLLPAAHPADGEERVPVNLIRLPESVATVFIAETSTARFHRFERGADALRYRGSRYMSIGQNGIGKQRSGDKRTPLGVYFVTEELDTTRLHEKYGARAFPLDYPNAWDQRHERTGSGIWVHGVDPRGGKRPPQDTDGCIALPNEDLAALVELFEDNITPVVITSVLEWRDAAATALLADELEAAVQEWATSVKSGDLHAYLSLYADDFERWGMQKAEWSALSLQATAKRQIDDVVVDDLLLLSYPDEGELYLSRFRQTVTENGKQIISTKRLYWRRTASGELSIIAEDNA